MTKAVRKTLIRGITNSLGRYLAILAITALGTGLFAGLKVSKDAMVNVYDRYIKEINFYDLWLKSTFGFIEEDIGGFEELEGVESAEGSYSMELILSNENHESVYKLITMPESINQVTLIEGRMPEEAGECLADSAVFSKDDIGRELYVSDNNKDSDKEAVSVEKYIITGIAKSPFYIHIERGSASIGNGKLSGFIYVTPESIKADYYTDIYLTLEAKAYVYSEEYKNNIADMKESVTELCELLTQKKYDDMLNLSLTRFDMFNSDMAADIPEEMSAYTDIPNAASYVLERTSNSGYASYENDTEIVSGISNIFPIFFFMVAILVCITTMVRMVDDERTQIGILKALGFGPFTIVWKYLFYAGSASLSGWFMGYMAGTYIIPKILWMAYNTLYRFSNISYIFDVKLAAATLAISMLCSGLAVLYSCYKELASCPAEIMRPKAPKGGKRVLIEYVHFIWNRLSFLMKVSVRNVFRYKNRLFMMILGVSGCTALLVAGFGIKDSIQNVAEYQYSEIMLYDAELTFTDSYENEEEFYVETGYDKSNFDWDKSILLNISSAEITADESTGSVSFVVFDSDSLKSFVSFRNDDGELPLPSLGEAVINSKMADKLKAGKDDYVTLTASGQREVKLRISGIFENYIGNYIYVSSDTCMEAWGEKPLYNSAYVKFEDGTDHHQESAKLLELKNIGNVSVNEDRKTLINGSLSSIDYIVILVVVCAGALAFIVIYNLTNINIIERTREIATINVLGFYPGETASYVLRENLILAGVGTILGLFLGKYLHKLIMTMITVNNIAFDVRISGFSYFISFVLTVMFSMLVNVLMFVKLSRIPMAESLKTVE